jgi:hypothetical protein
MRALRLGTALGATAFTLCVLTSASEAQQPARQRAPVIRVYSTSGADVINTSTYVTPQIALAENAYVFAVEMDLDGQIQVLHPDFPGLSVKVSAHTLLHLPNFFAGFNQGSQYGRYSSARYARYGSYGRYTDTRGTVIALASRAPFNLERIETGGDWNIAAIRRLIEYRTPEEAMSLLANYLGATDEPIGHDYMRFAGGSSNYDAYDDYAYFSPCDFSYGYLGAPGLGFAQLQALNRLNRARAGGQRARIIGYDICGVPIISYAPSTATRFPVPGKPRSPGDTTVFPKSRTPHGIPRHPASASSNGAPEGVFPLPHKTGVGQMGDVTITAPAGRRGEPLQYIDGYRSQPTALSAPGGRIPIERTIPRSEPSTSTGAQPVRESRPEPRVESPPPARAPAPVIHERPSTPPPPPPRAEAPTTRSEPPRSPPPSRQQ